MTERQPISGRESASIYRSARFRPILFMALIFFLTFVSRVVISPLMPRIENSLGIGHTQAGALFLFMAIGYFLSLIGSGFVSARVNHRGTIVLSACGVGLALCAISLSTGLSSLRWAVFALGVAAGLYLPSGITTLTDMVEPRRWGQALAFHEMAPNLGFVAAPLIAELLLIRLSWRGVPAVLGILSITIGLLFAARGKGGEFPGTPPGIGAFRALFVTRDFWIMVVLFGLAIGSTLGIYTMLPLFLIDSIGLSENSANILISVSRLFGMGSALISGWATDRFGPRRTIVFMLGLTGMATILLGAASGPTYAVIWVLAQAMLSTCFFPPGFAVLSSIGPPDYRNVVVSLTIPFAFILGGGLAPTFIGMTGDAGSFSAGIIALGALITTGAALPPFLSDNRR